MLLQGRHYLDMDARTKWHGEAGVRVLAVCWAGHVPISPFPLLRHGQSQKHRHAFALVSSHIHKCADEDNL